MAALNFVAVEDGLDGGPKTKTLARILRVHRGMALWFVVRFRRMILDYGDHITGTLPKNYSEEDIASFLEYEGNSRKLIAGLKRQGYLDRKRGRGFFYPDWENTVTGNYASQREVDRLWHEKKRKEKKRQSGDVGRQSGDTSADSRATSADIQTGRKEGRESGVPPVPPPKGGQAIGASRWEWLMEHAPTPQNKEVCTRYLSAMSADDWALVQWAYQGSKQGGVKISSKNTRTLAWPTDVFLRKTAFHRFSAYRRTFITASNEPAKAPAPEPEKTREEKMHEDWCRLEAYLEQTMWSQKKKEDGKAHFETKWHCKPWEGDRPWGKKGAKAHGQREARASA